VEQRPLQGWHADPFGLHERRYFSVGNPTKLVRDGDVESYDEPPAQDSAPTDVAALSGAVPTEVPAPTGAVPTEVPALTGVTPAGGSADTADSAAGSAPGEAAASVGEPSTVRPAAAAASRAPQPYPAVLGRRRRPGLAYTAIALLSVVIGVAVYLVMDGRGPNGGPTSVDLAAIVTRSAQRTLGESTADIALSGSVEIAGLQVDLHGNGQLDFATNEWAMTMSWKTKGYTVAENEIVTSHDLYFQASVDGRSLGQYHGGRDWFESPIGSSASLAMPQDNPVSSLQLLEQHGARVVSMGTQNIGGLDCSDYVVTPSSQALVAAAQQEWAKEGLSASETAAEQQQLASSTPPTFTIWVDPQRELLCQFDVYVQLGTETQAGSGSAPSTDTVQLLMTFTHYGAPVAFAPPPAAETVSF
jgi:hypothetical protein